MPNAIANGILTCEQLCFIYLAMLSKAGLDLFGSLANENLKTITMFNSEQTHVTLAPKKHPSWVWETTAKQANKQPFKGYTKFFDSFYHHDIKTFISVLTKLFCLDHIRDPDEYFREVDLCQREGLSYPSPDFYRIELVNKIAEKLMRVLDQRQTVENRSLCAQALKQLRHLLKCPYLKQVEVRAQIDWFKQITRY